MSLIERFTLDSLTGLAAFVHAAEARSFAAAGRQLGVSASAISKSIGRLEARLGVRLLNRTTRSVTLTEEGALFHQRCRRILDEIRDAEAALSHAVEVPRGRLRVSAPQWVGHRLLLPDLPAFLARFPEIWMDLDLEDRVVNVVEEGLDAVVRTGSLPDSGLMSRRLGVHRFVICGTPDYLRRRGMPMRPDDLAAHDCIRFKFPSTGLIEPWSLRGSVQGDENSVRVPASLVFNNTDAVVWAATAGLGLAQVPACVATHLLARGELRTVLDDFMIDKGSLWLLWPPNRHLSPKVRCFIDFAAAAVAKAEALQR